MITRLGDGGFMVTCEKCGYNECVDTDGELAAFKEIIKENGWTSHHKFVNLCEDCQSEVDRK